MKHEWRKKERELYLPENKPVRITIHEFKFFTIEGTGNPNDDYFSEYVKVLYALSYAVKMSVKKGIEPKGYFDYTVYPLEGVWDINEKARKTFNGTIDKNDLVFKLMIRQPDFVDENFAMKMIEITKQKKFNVFLDKVKFEKITDGECIQMMHLGSYDKEPESFKQMEEFAQQQDLTRISKVHREIYISDARKVTAEKLKTVLRFQVTSNE